jgi:hypothetical protein
MKSVALSGLALSSLLLLLSMGCTTPARPANEALAVALAVRVPGGGAPTSQQIKNIHVALRDHIMRAGYQFAPTADLADVIVTVTFTPDALEANGGHVAVTGVEPHVRNRDNGSGDVDRSGQTFEMRQKLREIENWVQSQWRNRC